MFHSANNINVPKPKHTSLKDKTITLPLLALRFGADNRRRGPPVTPVQLFWLYVLLLFWSHRKPISQFRFDIRLYICTGSFPGACVYVCWYIYRSFPSGDFLFWISPNEPRFGVKALLVSVHTVLCIRDFFETSLRVVNIISFVRRPSRKKKASTPL